MRHGLVILPQYDRPEVFRRWRAAEEFGFNHAWTYDHLAWRGLAGERWHATIPTLTAAALSTERIELGLFVTSPNFRHPVPFAKELGTVDDLAGGRLLLGVGSGGTGFDAFVLGQEELTPRQRHERYVEFVRGLDALLRFEEPGSGGISFAGDWFEAKDARMVGAPAREPRMPLLLAGNGPKSIRFAAEVGDGWVTTGGEADEAEAWWAGVAALAARYADAWAATGRAGEARSILSLDGVHGYSLASTAAYEDAVGRAAGLGFTDVVAHFPRESGLYAGDESVLEEVAALLPGLR
ncbi:LLM class flavin-dependent oxidoreductase [Agromyces seonyuensis]|uniref:LLM class flavin-dependent oxidoreductase n=1 Tax=Agromyces seonyuensis TaxID=2662446 RepID=A0A6I4P1U6_9MICO|nr:LLM class flavin-dependent oxidoreductase [Agromyces seonyuensis]MWB97114.1 LLM class flavin-dependent oxidoreductase [Agromyces seonyuensis]